MAKMTKFKYMLVDGNALIHRGYHAMPGLSTKDGKPTGAVYGFTLILLKAIADLKPTHVAVTFDLAAPTFRHEMYKEYKAGRVKAPQELYDQIPIVKEVVRTLNIPIFEKEGFEADDLLGTLATDICRRCKGECEVFIATGDLDTLQLVNDCVKVYTLRKGITDTAVYDEQAVKDRYEGLLPSQMLDYRAIKGDPSDNIPGVRGIGEKGAIELIKEFGSLDNLYKKIKAKVPLLSVKPRILELLKTYEQDARQSYELSKIVCDVPVEIDLPKYEFSKDNFEMAFKLFQNLEFKSLIARLPKNYGSTVNPEQVETLGDQQKPESEHKRLGKQKYELITEQKKLQEVIKKLEEQDWLAVDTETTGINAVEAFLVGVALCCDDGMAFYVPAKLALACTELHKLLAGPIKKIGHNLKYDYLILKNAGFDLANCEFDTMVAAYLLNSGTRQYSLDAVVFSELGYRMQPIEELIGKGKKQITMDQVEAEKVSWYSCEDVDMTYRLKNIFEPELKKEKLDKIFYDIEIPLLEVLAEMEQAGILIDLSLFKKLSSRAEKEIVKLDKEIHELAGNKDLNINSPIQLREVLYEQLKLVPPDGIAKKTKTGLSTAAGELEKMRGQHPIIEKLLEYRELSKLQSTYLLTLPQLLSKKTGRVHTSYNQTIAATGRLSSTDPNLQNIPVRGQGLGSEIRQGFVAKKGFKLLSLDYSQIELRIVAHIAQDKKMMEVFKRNEDIHTKTATEIFNVKENEVTPDMRRDAKTINFGILYGLSSFGLSSRIGEVSRAEAKKFIDKYFAAYPAVELYIQQIKAKVNKKGFIANELGRVRRFPEIHQKNWQVRAAAERAAVNFPIQSLAADVIKVAMINIHKVLNPKPLALNPDCIMLLQVHDELVFEVLEDKVEHYAKIIKPLMENAIKISVPVGVEAKAGNNWGEMEKLEI